MDRILMIYRLELPNIKPTTTNHYIAKTKRGFYKPKDTLIFEQNMEYLLGLKDNKKIINSINNSFKKQQNALEVEYFFYVPKECFFTKKGWISKRSLDLDNCVKNLQDCIFKKFDKGIDDKMITRLVLNKTVSFNQCFNVLVLIKIIDLEELKNEKN